MIDDILSDKNSERGYRSTLSNKKGNGRKGRILSEIFYPKNYQKNYTHTK